MHVKSVVSAAALTAAMLFSGSAFAQTSIGGIEVSPEDLAGVTVRCEELLAAATAPIAGEPEADNDETELPAEDGKPDANGLDQATSTIDLEAITAEQCTEAGIGGAM